MPTRAQVGSGDGVTNASMMPLTSSTATRPSAIVPGRAALAGERLRAGQLARLHPRPEQPQPGAAGHEDRGELEQAVREDQAPEVRTVVVADHDRADDRQVGDVLEEQVDHGQPEHPERDAERRDPGVVDPDLRREVAGGVLAVVVLEVVVDQLVDLLRARAGSARRRGGRAATASSRRSRTTLAASVPEPPPAQPVERGREPVDEEPLHPPPGAGAGARRAVAGSREQDRQVGDELGVRRRRAHDGQVGGDLLVALDQLVGLRSRQPPTPRERPRAAATRRRAPRRTRRGPWAEPRVTTPRLGAMATPEFATLTTDDLVTGEAVALDLPAASLGSRIASGLIDVVVTLRPARRRGLRPRRRGAADRRRADLGGDSSRPMVVFLVVFPTTIETLTHGKSLGKLVCGLRTVRDDAGPISFQHAFVRALIGVVEIYAFIGGAGVLLGAAQPARQAARRLRRRDVRRARPGPAPPPAADRRCRRRSPGGRRRPTWPRCRPGSRSPYASSSGGCPQIDPASRATIGGRLADQVSEYVAPAAAARYPARGLPRRGDRGAP